MSGHDPTSQQVPRESKGLGGGILGNVKAKLCLREEGQPQRKNIIRRMLVKEPGSQGLNQILAFASWVTLDKFCHLLVPQFPWEFIEPIPPLSQNSIRIKGNQRG